MTPNWIEIEKKTSTWKWLIYLRWIFHYCTARIRACKRHTAQATLPRNNVQVASLLLLGCKTSWPRCLMAIHVHVLLSMHRGVQLDSMGRYVTKGWTIAASENRKIHTNVESQITVCWKHSERAIMSWVRLGDSVLRKQRPLYVSLVFIISP